MDIAAAATILSALGQNTRLEAFRLLLQRGPTGIPAGDVANELGIPRNTMSAHLAVLARAGLVRSERDGIRIIYAPVVETVADLLTFLTEGCCDGKPELCGLEFKAK